MKHPAGGWMCIIDVHGREVGVGLTKGQEALGGHPAAGPGSKQGGRSRVATRGLHAFFDMDFEMWMRVEAGAGV